MSWFPSCSRLLLLCAVVTTIVPDAFDTGTVSAAAPMGAPRSAHTATTLVDGRVLVVGGFLAETSPVGVELYDRVQKRFVPVATTNTVRHSHTATRLTDGRVLIVGGYGPGNTPTTRVDLFDPATNRLVPTDALQQPRSGHVAVLLADGSVLIAGGLGPDWTFLKSAERYDPATGRFTPVGDMTTARESHVAVRLRNGRVLVVGGHQGRRANIKLFASAEEYDPATRRFTAVGDMQVRRHKHDAVLMADGQVLVTGGSDERDDQGAYNHAERYDPSTQRFTRLTATMHRSRYKHAGSSVLLPDGRVLIAGGATQAEVYDPVRRQFELVGGRSDLAGQFSAVALWSDGTALITGGYGAGLRSQASAWTFVP
jgi:hypothetical protein